MIKFALAVLAIIVVGAGIFMFTQSQESVTKTAKTSVQPQQSMVDNTKAAPQRSTTEVKHETAPVAQEKTKKVKTTKTEEKAPLPTKESTVGTSTEDTASSSGEDLDEIGKGLTLKSIEAMDASEEEKEKLRDDFYFYQSQHKKTSYARPSGKEVYDIIINDEKNGFQ